MGKHDPPKPVDPETDGLAPGIPPESDPGKHADDNKNDDNK
jgi:hypothetical protein